MKKKGRNELFIGIGFIALFVLWTAAICSIDVQPIGPRGSLVGFAAMNSAVHGFTGVNMSLYEVTDWLGAVPISVVMGFALLGLIQWIQRKHLLKVDYSLLVLGAFYTIVMAAYVFFEVFAVNFRPILIEGRLEASYPSSTTVLVLCVMPTAAMQINSRLNNGCFKRCIALAVAVFVVFMVGARLASGVHWCTDIIGGALLSMGLVLVYCAAIHLKSN